MSQANDCLLRVGVVLFTESDLHHSNRKTTTYSTFQNNVVDDALSREELNDIYGAGLWSWIKDKAEDAGDSLEEKLGDGEGKYEWKDDYRDDSFKVGIWILEILEKKHFTASE